METFEKLLIKIISPLLTAVTGLLGFIVTFDFTELRLSNPKWPGLYDLLENHKIFYWFVSFGVLAFIASLLVSLLSPTREKLRTELEAERERISKITDHVDFALQGFVWEQAKKLKFSEEGFSRISLYLHDANKGRFYCMVRRSHNVKFEKKGRPFFDDKSGCIAKAWESDWHFDNAFPDDLVEDAEYQKVKYGIKKSVHSNLTMSAKLIAAKRVVDSRDRPIALLVVESVRRNGFDEAHIKDKLSAAAKDCAHLLTAWKDHLPSPNVAESEGL